MTPDELEQRRKYIESLDLNNPVDRAEALRILGELGTDPPPNMREEAQAIWTRLDEIRDALKKIFSAYPFVPEPDPPAPPRKIDRRRETSRL
jgi:hypothetical protein